MNMIFGVAGLAAIIIFCMKFDGRRDENGNGFLGRLEKGMLTDDDRTFLKIEAVCIAVAILALAIWGL